MLVEYLSEGNTVVSFARSFGEGDPLRMRVDVGDRAQVKAAMDKVAENFGGIDLLVNNAGFGMSGATELIPEKEVRAIVDTNYLGALWCSQCALPYMKNGGTIINVSSASAIVPMVYRAMYNSTKAALLSLSSSMRMETARFGVNVTTIVLGAVDTKFSDNRHKIVYTNARYGDSVARADSFIDSRGSGARMNVERVAKKIGKIAAKRKPSMQYILGLPYKFASVVERCFPRFCVWIMETVFSSRFIKMLPGYDPNETESKHVSGE